jgi:hypothetical protein
MQPTLEKPEIVISDNYNMKKQIDNSQIVNPEIFNKFRKTLFRAQESQNETFETHT